MTGLRSHPELEAAIAADPADEATWQVYEDWLMSEGDPRAQIVVAERAKNTGAAEVARQQLASALYGKMVAKSLVVEKSRAGMLVAATLAPKRKEASIAADLAAAVGAQLMSRLTLRHDSAAVIAAVAQLPALAELVVAPPSHYTTIADAAVFAPLARLRRLAFAPNPQLVWHDRLAALPAVELVGYAANPIDIDRYAATPFAAATTVKLTGWLTGWRRGAIGRAFPAVEALELRTDGGIDELINALFSPALPPGLRRLRAGGAVQHEVPVSSFGVTAFRQLEELAVPYGYLATVFPRVAAKVQRIPWPATARRRRR